MKIPIIKESALEYWIDGTGRYYYLSPELHSIASKFDFKIDEVFAKNLSKEYNFTLPLNLMVPETNHRNHTEKANFFTWIKNIPYGSFCKLKDRGNENEEIFVSRPELTFLETANLFTLSETVFIGNLLCADFVFDNTESVQQRDRKPITSVRKIKTFLEKIQGVKGIRKAKLAANYIVDNCYSIREAELAAIAALPIKYGGYGMPPFVMNGKVLTYNDYHNNLGRKIIKCDLVWTKEKVVVEYESNLTHLDKNQHRYDKRRSTALSGSGYKVISITNEDINSFSKIEDTFFMLRKLLHIRRNQKEFNCYFDIRYEVYNSIFRKNFFHNMTKQKYPISDSKPSFIKHEQLF